VCTQYGDYIHTIVNKNKDRQQEAPRDWVDLIRKIHHNPPIRGEENSYKMDY